MRTRWRIWKAWGRKARRCCARTRAETPDTGWKTCEVRSCDFTDDELPLAGFRPVGGPLPALLGAVSAEFGPQLPKLAAELASGAPDLDSVERVLRDGSLGEKATALKVLFEQFDEVHATAGLLQAVASR